MEVSYQIESLHALLRNLLPGFLILIPFLDVILQVFGAQLYLLFGLLVSILSYGIHELYSPFLKEHDKWKKKKILESFRLNICERVNEENITSFLVRLYKHLQDESKFLGKQHEDAHRVTSYLIFFEITFFGTLLSTILRFFSFVLSNWNAIRSFLISPSLSRFQVSSFLIAGLLAFVIVVSFTLSRFLFFKKLKAIDNELLTFLSQDDEACKEFEKCVATYLGRNFERGISADVILCYLPTNSNSERVILEVRKSGRDAGKLSLPGGHALVSDENLKDTIHREVKEETSLDINPDSFEVLGIYDERSRDERYVSVCYYIKLKKYSELNEAACKLEANPHVPEQARCEVERFEFFPLDKEQIVRNQSRFCFEHHRMLLDFIDRRASKSP